MATRDELDEAQTLLNEALAMYDAACAEFQVLKTKMRSGYRTDADYEAFEAAERKLFKTRARLMRLHRERDRNRRH